MLKPFSRAELHFDLEDEVSAEGRNSKVYLANDHQLRARLVIKCIEKKKFSDPTGYFDEASVLYEGGHSNVVPIHYACQDEDYIYLAMPYFSRGSLNALINSRFLTVREIIRYSLQFLSGLHNIHSKSLIHFDIKPDNILLSDRDEAMVADFGLVQRMSPDGGAVPASHYTRTLPPEAIVENKPTRLHTISTRWA